MPTDPPKPQHDHTQLNFPEGFLWGAATSAYQVEGNNIYADWWDWEQKVQPPQLRSGLAADQYHRFETDFDLAKHLRHNAHRLSIEWSRIEPREGEFDHHEIEHYQKVLKALKDRNFTVMLTLWHFTLPKWLADKGGWENPKAIFYFERFVQRVVPELRGYVDFWITLNEPSIYVWGGYVVGLWPPQKISRYKSMRVFLNLAAAHRKVYKLLHKLDPEKAVGMAHNIQSFEPYHKHSIREQLLVLTSDIVNNHLIYYFTRGYHDFIGVNYYTHHRFKPLTKGLLPPITKLTLDMTHDVSDLGWEIFPEGIFDVLVDISDHLPIFITECGIASTNDDRRSRFLIHYLQEVYRAIKAGVDVRGFFYWSLIDNFEWHRGYDPRFGLIEVDYKTQERIIRPSAYLYSEIIRNNGIHHHLLRFLGHTIKVEEVLCFRHRGPKELCSHLEH